MLQFYHNTHNKELIFKDLLNFPLAMLQSPYELSAFPTIFSIKIYVLFTYSKTVYRCKLAYSMELIIKLIEM